MSRSLSRFQAVFLGMVVVAAVALAASGLHAVGSRQLLWGEIFRLQVGFKQVQGVDSGTRVRVRGIDAGEVEHLRLPDSAEGDVVLVLRLAGRFQGLIRADASATIASESMLAGKVIEIDPGSGSAPAAVDGATIAGRSAPELGDLLRKLDTVLQDVRDGKGTLGKLYTDPELYHGLKQLAEQGRGTLTSIQQDADAIKALPIIRNFVKDPHRLLVRPDCEANRQVFTEAELFEPGHAVLTGQGRYQLDRLVPWLAGLKHRGSEVVVAGYTAPHADAQLALTLSQKQCEAVCRYLKDAHAVHKMGPFSRREVTPIGLGTSPPPVAGTDPLPVPRIEVIVFVPQG